MSQTLGDVLRAARQAAGLSLRDVERATRGRLSNGHLSLLEANEVKQPSPHHLYVLSTVLRLDYSELMRLAGYVVPGQRAQVGDVSDETLVRKTADFSPAEKAELENYIDYIRTKRSRQ